MTHPAGETEAGDLRVDFDRRLRSEFQGSRITSDAGLLAFRELDDALGLTGIAGEILADSRTGWNSRHSLMAHFRQSVFGRLAGYEDVNDADRLGADPAMCWIVGGQSVTGQAASTSQMGRFETEVLAKEANVTALADLSGRWIDVVHACRPTNVVVLDMDSSVSPTHGEQGRTVYNGHFGCIRYHPLFVFNQFGDLERCSLRFGNVHSADGWRDVLEPVVARYRGGPKRRFFRGDAAFALPGLYDFLEAEGYNYAIRLKANPTLQRHIANLLKRPVGRPPSHVRRLYASFRYQAGSWSRKRRVVAKVEWHPGELCPRVGFIVTNLARGADRVVVFYNQRGTAEQYIKEGKNAVKWTRLSCRTMRGNAVAAPASCVCPQPCQLPGHSRASARGAALVADNYPRQTREDWREAGQRCPICRLPDGRGSGAPRPVPPYPCQHRGSAMSSNGAMLTASSEPCFGTDRKVASGFRENHVFCVGRANLCPDWNVTERLKAPDRENPVAQCRPTRQSRPQSGLSRGPSGKCRYSQPMHHRVNGQSRSLAGRPSPRQLREKRLHRTALRAPLASWCQCRQKVTSH